MSCPAVVRERAVLAPAGHPAVDQPRVAGQAVVGAEPEPLGGAGAHALEQHVGVLDEREHGLDRLGALQVERDARPAAGEQVGLAGARADRAARPLDPDHVGAEVGQDRRGVRPGPDPGDLDDPDAPQRSGALPECVAHGRDLTAPLSQRW